MADVSKEEIERLRKLAQDKREEYTSKERFDEALETSRKINKRRGKS